MEIRKVQETVYRNVYVAKDGKEFNDSHSCTEYENMLDAKQDLTEIKFVNTMEDYTTGKSNCPAMFIKDKNSFMAFAKYANKHHKAMFYLEALECKYKKEFDGHWVYATFEDNGYHYYFEFNLLDDLLEELSESAKDINAEIEKISSIIKGEK